MNLIQLLETRGAKATMRPNKIKIPIIALDNTKQGAHEFNNYYKEVLAHKAWNTITRTKSGGISFAKKVFLPPMWDIRYTNACIELTIVAAKMLRIQFRQTTSTNAEEREQQIYGHQAFIAFKKELASDGIYLDDYIISNGADVKKEIPKYIIKLERQTFCDMTFNNCHHIDFHNSFPAGLVNTHKEFEKTISRLYAKRKEKPINKAILNYSIGYMQSISCCGAKWAHLSKDAITDNNARIEELAEKLKTSGRLVISYNTDGIWYSGEIYHGTGEGKLLGQWENDHINCKFRAKSAGSYEFIENGKYFPVVRGRTNYDLIKPRQEWEWGDIYRKEAAPLQFYWINDVGIVDCDNNII